MLRSRVLMGVYVPRVRFVRVCECYRVFENIKNDIPLKDGGCFYPVCRSGYRAPLSFSSFIYILCMFIPLLIEFFAMVILGASPLSPFTGNRRRRTLLLFALVIWPLTTYPFHGGASFLLLVETLQLFGARYVFCHARSLGGGGGVLSLCMAAVVQP